MVNIDYNQTKRGLTKVVTTLNNIDDIYKSSPTAQMLVANAPAILAHFKELNAQSQANAAQLQALAINRNIDLQRFKEVAGDMKKMQSQILERVMTLQDVVREQARLIGSDASASTVIEYTNRQIDQNIRLFNQLTFSLLNA